MAGEANLSRLPVIGVMGSGTMPHEHLARPLGEFLAKKNVNLLNGGGGGVMESISRAFFEVKERKGKIIGILPGHPEHPDANPPGYPNQYIEIAIKTHLPYSGTRGTDLLSRNHINILSSDAIIALPGSNGTLSEIALAAHYRKPLVVFMGENDKFPHLPENVKIARNLAEIEKFLQSIDI
ncbi:MAG: hypothetical protein COV36_05710 [Alphaproteobacteria bacterium CG11_big_fil_rev_8_21_14_0_20_44_7]|nr:MAG: hypothetical protein COV36_05710 [Alphaproteobacteria bacterium CG11_big_fil_rev_8_21_14_0_20_44_7]